MIPQILRSPIKICSFTILIYALLLSGCTEEESKNNNGNQLIPAVEAVQAHFGALPLTERLSGLVRAENQVEIYPEVNAAIVSVFVENGDYVKRGQALVQLRDKEFQERLKQAQASYQIAEAQLLQAEAQMVEIKGDLQRIQSLSDQGLASTAELENVQAESQSAEADIALARARVAQAQAIVDERNEILSQTTIRAPISGRIGNRRAEVGMLVNNNTRLFILGQMDNVRVQVILTDYMLDYIKIGQRAEIDPTGRLSEVLSAPLVRVSPFLHPVTHTTQAEIELDNKDGRLMPGMFVTVDIFHGESERATLVPLSALYDSPTSGETGVYIPTEALNLEPASLSGGGKGRSLSDPISFKFVPVEIIAKGRMEAGIRGIEPDNWVVVIGQDLLAGQSTKARVRTVDWDWVRQLQNLQREDLLQDIMQKQQVFIKDSTSLNMSNGTGE